MRDTSVRLRVLQGAVSLRVCIGACGNRASRARLATKIRAPWPLPRANAPTQAPVATRISAVAGGWDLGYNTRPPSIEVDASNGKEQTGAAQSRQ